MPYLFRILACPLSLFPSLTDSEHCKRTVHCSSGTNWRIFPLQMKDVFQRYLPTLSWAQCELSRLTSKMLTCHAAHVMLKCVRNQARMETLPVNPRNAALSCQLCKRAPKKQLSLASVKMQPAFKLPCPPMIDRVIKDLHSKGGFGNCTRHKRHLSQVSSHTWFSTVTSNSKESLPGPLISPTVVIVEIQSKKQG